MLACQSSDTIGGQERNVPLRDVDKAYSFIKYDENKLLFPNGHTDFDKFYGKLDTLLREGKGKINIVHIGGSHVQAGFFEHQLRTDFAGLDDSIMSQRGLLFPFGLLHTNEPYGYCIACSGEWSGTKCIKPSGTDTIGLAGAAVSTTDNQAKLSIHINLSDSARFSFNRLRILGYATDSTSHPYAIMCGDTLRARRKEGAHSYIIDYPAPCDSADIGFSLSEGGRFTLEGIIPENDRAGLTYYAAGVNGADVTAWLRCGHLQTDLDMIRPDMAVFGIGINDANVPSKDFKPEVFKERYRQLISKFKAANPDCALLFITNNDCLLNLAGKRGKQFNPNTARVATAFKELAAEYGGAVWDQYYIMGGARSSALWKAKNLMRNDRIHFTAAGYRLLGDLLYNAIAADYMRANGD